MTDSIGPQVVGDRCFLAYRDMLRRWRHAPKWTTAHEIRNGVLEALKGPVTDDTTALDLAWQVFFQLHVIPFEMQKRTLNGEIDY